ncbi:MAG: hypothetical protein JXM70_23405 [Pirellulales bacterium]|nr:hypothetical protein [Pirellulales bacterium]
MYGLSLSAYILLNLINVASASFLGLLAIWAALADRPHWAIRCCVLLGMILLLFLIPAHELVVMYLIQSIMVIVVLFFWKTFRKQADGSRLRWQFSLRDILLLTFLTAVVLEAASSAHPGSWTIDKIGFRLLSGALLAMATLLACGLAFSKRRLWRSVWLSVLTMVFGAATFTHYYDKVPYPNDPFAIGCITVVTAAWILLAKYANFRSTILDATTKRYSTEVCWKNYFAQWACFGWAVLTLFILIPTAGTLYFMATPPPIPDVAMPEPNGYKTLVRIGKELQKISTPDPDIPGSATTQTLTTFERECGPLLNQAREALQQECRVPVVLDETYFKSHAMTNNTLYYLASSFIAQGTAAQMKGDNTKATECYIDVVRMGKASDRGRVLTFFSTKGSDCEFTGIFHLHKLHTSLSNEQLTNLSTTLRSLQKPDEPLDSIIAREEIAYHYIFGWNGRLYLMLYKMTGFDPHFLTKNDFKQRLVYYRILLIEIALRQYEEKYHEYPEKLDELIPEFLEELPDEPYGANGFVYRLNAAKPGTKGKPAFEIYSPGPNHRDEGGGRTRGTTPHDDMGFF